MTDFTDFFWTSYEGLPLHARDYAAVGETEKLPVICLHGLTRNARDFEDLAPRIAATGRRVLAADVRGRGLSARDPNPMNYHPGTYAADVISLLAAAGIERAVFVGTSMGGLVTMVLTSIKPEAIAAAVLNDVGPELSPVGLGRIAGYAGGASRFETWEAAVAYAKAINAAAFPNYGAEDWDIFARRLFDEADGGFVLAYDPDISAPIKAAAEAAAKAQAEGGPNGGQALAPPDMYPLFRALAKDRPLLLVRGGISDLVDAGIAERMRAAAPSMAYAEVPGVGHAPMLTEPQAWAAIENLLAEAP
ncbi:MULTISPECIES: alpha/beta fold hydrolase [unclassified Caulobacter]|jgi:pimeloyl-ACP methyl ester carboxylesterase|uniref:alpha/beta fold hydrolase n=1 Tax=unclassified Caulobacter TaxID=2648921 RepID=UPI0006F6064F|nr:MULTISPECIES: alpha/beta hydrolase [unclassified Caulobacter]KQV62055.1 alpha/beta hydrolase [Caulobacter sp. Root342]KQV64733.1 alpha/beta hydrolase [Caulobacter sp. Root343]